MEFYGIAIWIALSIVAGIIANNKGRSAVAFFLLALILSPLLGILAAFAVKPDIERIEKETLSSGHNIKCPYCAEIVKLEAIVCRHCRRDIKKKDSSSANIMNIEFETNAEGENSQTWSALDMESLKTYGEMIGRAEACATNTEDAKKRIMQWVDSKTFKGPDDKENCISYFVKIVNKNYKQQARGYGGIPSEIKKAFNSMEWP